jgi:hypothetical protein
MDDACMQDEDEPYRSVERKFSKLQSPESHKDVGLFRVSGVFPTVSKNGEKLAFVDNEFKSVWIADSNGLREVYKVRPAGSPSLSLTHCHTHTLASC